MSVFKRGGSRDAGPLTVSQRDRREGLQKMRTISIRVAVRATAMNVQKRLRRLLDFNVAGEQIPHDLGPLAIGTSACVQTHPVKYELMPASQIACGRQIAELIEQYMTHCKRHKHNGKYLFLQGDTSRRAGRGVG